ncbi:MAG TPA: SDR family oxidoreductase [Puia sp.]|nr:SDR family oxidoreductase [Puia sp.]
MSYALITGASKGIGRSIAVALAGRGFSVLLVARSASALQEQAERLKKEYHVDADWLATDLTNSGATQTIFDWCMKKNYEISVLVNNAGYGLSGPFEKYTLAEQQNMMQLNMIVPVELCQRFLPVLYKQPKAYILNIASTTAYQAVPYLSLYAATKAFILTFSRGLRQELHGSNISVTCISPGATDTDFVVRAQLSEKGLKTAKKVHMTADAVAGIAVRSMLAGRAEVITGIVNKLGAFLVWLLPKGLVERSVMKIYE